MTVRPSKHILNCFRKTLGGFRFVLNKLPHYDLVLKLDDDLDIRSNLVIVIMIILCSSSDALASALAEHLPWQPATLYCYQLKNITPLRWLMKKKQNKPI